VKTIEEKLALLSDLIVIAKSDNHISEEEYELVFLLAKRMHVEKELVRDLFDNPVASKPIATEIGRLTHFHSLVVMMNVDLKTKPVEVVALRNFGLKMGIRPGVIDQVMIRMNDYENKIIPSEELIKIFQTYYN